MRRLFLAAAVLATVAAVFVWARLPPKQIVLPADPGDGTVPGALHIHSSRSDGRGTPEDIARAAARAGLTFIVITDHGDGTRAPDPPVYRDGVLCLDGVEISTTGGHYIAIGMARAPYPLGGEPRDVVEDVRRLGGFGIAAHPDSPKPELAWRDWTAPFDAIEILNLDTAWRRRVTGAGWRARAGLVERFLTYPVRPAESIASLITRSDVYYHWDALAKRRQVVTLGGADAHAQIAWRAGDPIATRLSAPIPSYEASFRAASVRVRPDRPLTGTAEEDAALILHAIRAGHLYTAVDGAATPPSFDFTATDAAGTARAGDELTASGPVTLHVRSNAPDGFTTTIWNGLTAVAGNRTERDVTVSAPAGPAVYWVEIRGAGARAGLPWLTSNAIYVRPAGAPSRLPVRPAARATHALFDGKSTAGWTIEHDPISLGALDVTATDRGQRVLYMRYGLAGGPPSGQFVALGVQTPEGLAPNTRLSFTARAEQPMRISVQLRAGEARWQRSVYVGTAEEAHTIFLDDFTPIGETDTYTAPVADIRSVLLVVDTTNTKPGASGRLWISAPALQE